MALTVPTMFRKVSFEEAAAYSPWPERIKTNKPWKNDRNPELVREEYNKRYKALLDTWKKHVEENTQLPAALLAPTFLAKFDAFNWKQILAAPQIYGEVTPEESLISFQGELYVGNALVAEGMFRQMVVEVTNQVAHKFACHSILELGCGTGYNLVKIATQLGLKCYGTDLSPHVIEFLVNMAETSGIDITANVGNYLEDELCAMVDEDQDWGVLSVHAIEQVPVLGIDWFGRLLGAANSPKFGLHFEPIHSSEPSEFSDQCLAYAKINDYNRSLSEAANKAQELGMIEIIDFKPYIIGSTAFNPTGMLLWRKI